MVTLTEENHSNLRIYSTHFIAAVPYPRVELGKIGLEVLSVHPSRKVYVGFG